MEVHPPMKRHEVKILRHSGQTQRRVAEFTQVSERTIRRIDAEPLVENLDPGALVSQRGVGRPTKVEAHRSFVRDLLAKDPTMMSLEVLRQARQQGYDGGKTQFYDLVTQERPNAPQKPLVRFEGFAGEFCQHDFGEVNVRYANGESQKFIFFASRLKYSRWVEVTIVPDQRVETLVRSLVKHYDRMGGVPLVSIFDRPKTVAHSWKSDGTVTEWNSTFQGVMFELGAGVELCWPYRPQEKGSVENLVGWVKGSFFKPRRFIDEADVHQQLEAWHEDVNTKRENRATGETPLSRMTKERERLRPLRVKPGELMLRYPVQVGPTGVVGFDGARYSMPPSAIGIAGTLYLGEASVRITAGRWEATHPRVESGMASITPEHRAQTLAMVSGRRGRLCLKREQLLELGEVVLEYLTEVVHRRPASWKSDVERMHELLTTYGEEALLRAITTRHTDRVYGGEYVQYALVEAREPARPKEAIS